MALKGKKLRQQVAYVVAGDARFRVLLPGKGLLCPWCLKVAFPNATGQELVKAVADHLEHECTVARRDPDTPMMSEITLEEMAWFLLLKDEFQSNPAYRVFGPDGRWICPYCARYQDIGASAAGEGSELADRLVQGVKRHLGKCFQYQDHPKKHLSADDLKARISLMEQQKSYCDAVATLMKSNPIMQFYDRDGHWVCPFCQQSVDYVDMSTPVIRERTAPARAAKHLASECPAARTSRRCSVRTGEMAAIVDRINSEMAASVAPAAPTPGGRPDDTAYLKALSQEVLTLREEVKRNEGLAQSMERARSVQQSMLPRETPEIPGYEFSAVYHPCEGISGDFYDIFSLDPIADFDPEQYQEVHSAGECVGVLIGDVSGHGLEAALVMGMAKKAFNVRAEEGLSAAGVMRKVNADVFPDLQEGMFLSAAFSILDPWQHSLALTRAGHNPAILLRAETKDITLVKPAGMIVGVDRGPRFDLALQEETVELKPGDVFLQYTDGITEAMNASSEEFGLGRLADIVGRTAGQGVEIIAGEVTTAVEHFMGARARQDDVTLLLLRRLP